MIEKNLQQEFQELSKKLFAQLQKGEEASLYLMHESQDYLRLNDSKVRQATHVDQNEIDLILQKNKRKLSVKVDLTGNFNEDIHLLNETLKFARTECESLPEDPFVSPMEVHPPSCQEYNGHLPELKELVDDLCNHTTGSDFTGLTAAGIQARASANSLGQNHWFSTESFFVDYSLFTKNVSHENKAVKGCYAGRDFSTKQFLSEYEASREMLEVMKKPTIKVQKGSHRVYLAPAAVSEILSMFSWGAVSFDSYKKGTSAFQRVADKQINLSPQFTVKESFSLGLGPQFNNLGEVAPTDLTIIENGQMKNFLVSTRTAKEYGVQSNGADYSMWGGEYLRSPQILGGSLPEAQALKALGTGLYISNLHYLNWSDFQTARLTGMTRYACLWVENGHFVGPIQDLRFDESLFRIFGSELEQITQESKIDPAVDTYVRRSLGGRQCPGVLVKDFRFTL